MILKTKSKPAVSRLAFHAYTEHSSRAGYNRETTSFNMFKAGLMFSHGLAPSCWRALMRRGWREVHLAPSMTWCSRRPLPLFFSMDFYDREELERGVLHAPCQLCTGPGSKPRGLDWTQAIMCAGPLFIRASGARLESPSMRGASYALEAPLRFAGSHERCHNVRAGLLSMFAVEGARVARFEEKLAASMRVSVEVPMFQRE